MLVKTMVLKKEDQSIDERLTSIEEELKEIKEMIIDLRKEILK